MNPRCGGFDLVTHLIITLQLQVLLLLINCLFSMPLQWNPQCEIDHLELFAGDCAVSQAEFQDGRHEQLLDLHMLPSLLKTLKDIYPITFRNVLKCS